jgi:hypothetical protein
MDLGSKQKGLNFLNQTFELKSREIKIKPIFGDFSKI